MQQTTCNIESEELLPIIGSRFFCPVVENEREDDSLKYKQSPLSQHKGEFQGTGVWVQMQKIEGFFVYNIKKHSFAGRTYFITQPGARLFIQTISPPLPLSFPLRL